MDYEPQKRVPKCTRRARQPQWFVLLLQHTEQTRFEWIRPEPIEEFPLLTSYGLGRQNKGFPRQGEEEYNYDI